MGRKYAIRDQGKFYFVTFTVVYWLDVFIREEYKSIFIDCLKYCKKEKGLLVGGSDDMVASTIAHYSFDGNAIDISGNGFDGTVFGATPTEDRNGNSTNALYFDGIDDHITMGNLDFNSSNEVTISFWMNTSENVHQGLMYKFDDVNGDGLTIHIDEEGNLSFQLFDAPFIPMVIIETEGSYNDGEWHLINAIYNPEKAGLWVDGQLLGSIEPSWSIDVLDSFEFIVGEQDSHYFRGEIDDLQIHNRALNSREIAALYNGQTPEQIDDASKTLGLAHYDYGFRIYNPALGRFLSVDPLSNNYAYYSPYQFAGNKPIYAIDLDGLEEKPIILRAYFNGHNGRLSYNQLLVNEQLTKQVRSIMMKRYFLTERETENGSRYSFDSKSAIMQIVLIDGETNATVASNRYALYRFSANKVLDMNDEIFGSQQQLEMTRRFEDHLRFAVYLENFSKELKEKRQNQKLEFWKDVSDVTGKFGDGVEVVGYVIVSIPGGQAVGGALIATGRTLSIVGSTAEALLELSLQNDKLAEAKVGLFVFSEVAGKVIQNASKTKKIRAILEAANKATSNSAEIIAEKNIKEE